QAIVLAGNQAREILAVAGDQFRVALADLVKHLDTVASNPPIAVREILDELPNRPGIPTRDDPRRQLLVRGFVSSVQRAGQFVENGHLEACSRIREREPALHDFLRSTGNDEFLGYRTQRREREVAGIEEDS